MKNNPMNLVLLSMLLIILICPTVSYCQTRPFEPKVITSVHKEHSSYSGNTDNMIIQYRYQPDNRELIDSVLITRDNPPYSVSYDYTGSISYANDLKYIHYTITGNYTMDIIKNAQNRITQCNFDIPFNNAGLYMYNYHYNGSGRTDTLSIIREPGSFEYESIYDDQGMLSAIAHEGYNFYDQVTYPTGYPTHPIDLNIDEVLPYVVPYDVVYNYTNMLFFRMLFDQQYQVASFLYSGQTCTPVYQNTDSYQMSFTYSGDYSSHYGYSLKFDDDGYVIYYGQSEYGMEGGAHTSFTFTWEPLVPNNDPVAPTPDLSMNVYPNPFRGNLKIELLDKSTSPSEIAIYNIKGQLIRKWSDNRSSTITWDGKDRFNSNVSSGVYIIKASIDGKSHSSKIVKF